MKTFMSLCIAAAVAATFSSTGAIAKSWTIEEAVNHDDVYCVHYVPATYKIDTKGIKVRGVVDTFSGTYADKHEVVFGKSPAVYKQTKTLVEADHYSLVPGKC